MMSISLVTREQRIISKCEFPLSLFRSHWQLVSECEKVVPFTGVPVVLEGVISIGK